MGSVILGQIARLFVYTVWTSKDSLVADYQTETTPRVPSISLPPPSALTPAPFGPSSIIIVHSQRPPTSCCTKRLRRHSRVLHGGSSSGRARYGRFNHGTLHLRNNIRGQCAMAVVLPVCPHSLCSRQPGVIARYKTRGPICKTREYQDK
jgi:hypothetical protein